MRRSMRSRQPNHKVDTDSFELDGGLNLVDPPLNMPDGMLLAATNYELLPRGGYRRIDGFERSDGQARPSDQTYWVMYFDTGDIAEPVVDGIVSGATSGATGKVGVVVVSSGNWNAGNAVGYVVIYTLTGVFVEGEVLSFTAANPAYSSGFSSGFS
jgi:hypothetical protein